MMEQSHNEHDPSYMVNLGHGDSVHGHLIG
jgi:hypothetical protein